MAPFIIIAIIFLGLGLLIWNKLRYDIIALLLLFLALILKVVKYQDAYLGFMNPAVISVACIMVISKSFIHSNVLYLFMEKSSKWMGSQIGYVALLVSMTTLFSMFMNNVGALSLVLPIALKTAEEMGHSKSSVLMPIAFGAGLGGLCTAFGTPPNLLISNFRVQASGKPFSVFDFAPVGLSVSVIGVLFLIFLGWRIVNTKRKEKKTSLSDIYICQVTISTSSIFIGKSLSEVIKILSPRYSVHSFYRKGKKISPLDEKLLAHDRLILETKLSHIDTLVHKYKTVFEAEKETSSVANNLAKAVVLKNSPLVGKDLKKAAQFSGNSFHIVGIKKSIENQQGYIEPGDEVLVTSKEEIVNSKMSFVKIGLLDRLDPIKEIKFKNFIPFIFFGLAIALNILKILPLQIALSFAVILILLTKALPMSILYESVNWPVIILLGAMIPIANSFQTSGGAEIISRLFLDVFCACHPILLLSLIMLVTIFLSDLINNTATALIMAPIAVDVAKGVGLNVDTFLMAVAIGASCSFATPIGHQNNVIVLNLGNYRFKDYLKLGVPLEALVFAVALPALLLFWPIYKSI